LVVGWVELAVEVPVGEVVFFEVLLVFYLLNLPALCMLIQLLFLALLGILYQFLNKISSPFCLL
jgi:hypothetical protein